jgi:hypothetical protein
MNYIIVYLFIIYIIYYIINKSINYELFTINKLTNTIPKIIISTYHNKEYIPQKVYDNIKEFAPYYNHIIYDDEDIVLFLKKYFDSKILNTFYNLKHGAHKADLFRYCYLYQFGGIYLDIKTKLIQNIDTIFNKKDTNFYTVLSMHKNTVYQGIIASFPKNPLFLMLIDTIVEVQNPEKYFGFTYDFYKKIKLYYNKNNLEEGYYKDPYNKEINLYLFQEKCSRNNLDCDDGLDRYNKCCFIYDKNYKIIKTRYSDYPWNNRT